MDKVQQLDARREVVLQQMRSIRSMKRGTISGQWFPVIRRGKKTDQRRGPYPVLTYKANNKTVSQRLTSKSELEHARRAVQNHKRFVALCKEFVELTKQLGEFERGQPDLDAVKKPPKSPSSKTGK